MAFPHLGVIHLQGKTLLYLLNQGVVTFWGLFWGGGEGDEKEAVLGTCVAEWIYLVREQWRGGHKLADASTSLHCLQASLQPTVSSKQEEWDGWYFCCSPWKGASVLHENPRTTQSGYSGKHSWDLIILDGPFSLNYSILPYSPLKAVRLSPWVITKAGTMLY